ncbi:MAG: hypothetical protein CGW95_09445 [Phenylobacterium zucineum]|nr:MAG: hypothetical protein CGW95_09445 [Phenylobacterium zucineum]
MKPKYDPEIHGDPPPLTDDLLSKMRSAREVHGKDWVDRAMGRKRGRPKSENAKVEVKIRLDAATVEHLRNSGPGWQTRINALLVRMVATGQI